MLKRVGESRHPCRTPNCCSEPVSYAAVEADGTSGLVIEFFDDLDKVCADVVLLHGCPQSCMPNPVESLLEVYEDFFFFGGEPIYTLWALYTGTSIQQGD